MNFTYRNLSELEQGLASLQTSSPTTPIHSPIKSENEPRPEDIQLSNSATRAPSTTKDETYKMSTHGLLYNLCGLQSKGNTKLDILNDTLGLLNRNLSRIADAQEKQTELLLRIAHNTSQPVTVNVPADGGKGSKVKSTKSLSYYGFPNNKALVSEFIMAILRQAEVEIRARDKGYRSSRTINRNMVSKAVEVVCTSPMKRSRGEPESPPIALPASNTEACVYLASKIGSNDQYKPVLNSSVIVTLLNDQACRPIISAIVDVIERMKIIRYMIPFYEADILNSLVYPYFTQDEKLICDWSMLQPRSETETEAVVVTAAETKKANFGKFLLMGGNVEVGVSAYLK